MNNIWIPFLSAMVGGILVLAGQYLDRIAKTKNEFKSNLREIYSYSRMLEALMKNNYRELASAKVHVEYWWYCYETQTGQRHYEEHLRSQNLAREIERKIGETKADFIGHVRKFQAIKQLNGEVENYLDIISNLTNEKAKKYSKNLSYEEVKNEMVEEDETELRNKYYLNLDSFKKINDYLQGLLPTSKK